MYITHVLPFGNFLKIYGQALKDEAILVERSIQELIPIVSANSPPSVNLLNIGMRCLCRYTDGNFYRSEITGIGIDGIISVYFCDFGNEEKCPISEIRTLDFPHPRTVYLCSIRPQASHFILARIVGNWSPNILEKIHNEIVNETFDAKIESEVPNSEIKLISISYNGQDYSQVLISQNLAEHIPLVAQEMKLRPAINPAKQMTTFAQSRQAEYHHNQQMKGLQPARSLRTATVQQAGYLASEPNMNPPYKPNLNPFEPSPFAVRNKNADDSLQYSAATLTKLKPSSNARPVIKTSQNSILRDESTISTSPPPSPTLASFKTMSLPIRSSHHVYCPHIEDGPNLFAIQLTSSFNDLYKMMDEMKQLKNLKVIKEKLIVGMACLARYPIDSELYRAVIEKISTKTCNVFFVDYGNSESVSFSEIYQIPPQFLKHTVFALRFALSGYKELDPLTEPVRTRFQSLVLEKEFKLTVTPLEGIPFFHYGELYTEDNTKVIDELRKVVKPSILMYPPGPILQKDDSVLIRYVDSPHKFYVQTTSTIPAYNKLMDDLLLYCQKMKEIEQVEIGMACAVKYNEDNEWYRAKVMKINGEQILCSYVDFGNTQEVKKNVIRELTQKFVQLPPQAIECCLFGFENQNLSLDSARVQLEMLVESSDGIRKPIKLSVVKNMSDQLALVNLFDETQKPPLNISKTVIKNTLPQNTFLNYDRVNRAEVLNSTGFESSIPINQASANWNSSIRLEQTPIRIQSSQCWDTPKPSEVDTPKTECWDTPKTECWDTPIQTQNNNKFNAKEEVRRIKSFTKSPSPAEVGNGRFYNPPKNSSSEEYGNRRNDNSKDAGESSETSGQFSASTGKTENSWNENSNQQFNQPEIFVPYKTEFASKQIPLNTKENVFISFWLSPHSFYVTQNDDSKKYEQLATDLILFYKNRPTTLDSPAIGSSIVARFPLDNLPYRAKVVNFNANLKKYKVEFVDYGNTSIVTLEHIWMVEKRFMLLPRNAIHCSLVRIVSNGDNNFIQRGVDKYIKKDKILTCEFVRVDEESGRYFVKIESDRIDLKHGLMADSLVSDLPEKITLKRLIGQTVHIRFCEISNLGNFSIQIDGCDINLMCSYRDVQFTKDHLNLTIEFKQYLMKMCQAKVEDVTQDNILMLTLYIPLLNEIERTNICSFPLLSNSVPVFVVSVEKENIVYSQHQDSVNILDTLLDEMFGFYEKSGTSSDTLKPNDLCAAKSPDGNWYRSLIISSSTADHFEVFYIDYGNTEKITKSNIKILEPDFRKLSALAVKTYLPIKSEHDLNIVKTEIVSVTAGHPLSLDIIEFYKGNWIVDFSSSGNSFISLLESRNVVKRIELNEVHEIIDQIVEVVPEIEVEPEETVKTDKIEAIISHTDNPGRFYLQLKTDIEKVDKLQENLQIVASQLPPLAEYKVGVLCIAQYSFDDLWYRAKIIDVGNGVVTIQFIDYGNTEVFAKLSDMETKIKEMNEAFIGYKEYTISCSLPVGPKRGEDFSDEACSVIYDASDDRVTFEYISTGPKNYVKVYWKENELSEVLIKRNLANSLEVIKSGEKCFVCHLNSLSDFYVQLESDLNALEIMSAYCSEIEKFDRLLKPEVGMVCLAKFPDDGAWYRAKILDTQKIEVLFIDYGNTAFTDELRVLPKEIADLPVLSKRCCLYLPENLNVWSEIAERKFNEISATGATTFTVELKTPKENLVEIELFLNGKNIRDDLLMPNSPGPNNNATICYLNSPTDFYIHLESQSDKLTEMAKNLEDDKSQLHSYLNPRTGDLCIATFPNDNKNYRAKIVTTANDGFDALFIDYGTVSFVKETYFMPNDLKMVEPLAIHCALNDEKVNVNFKFSRNFYEETAKNKTFQFTMIDDSVEPKIIELFSEGQSINFMCEEEVPEIVLDESIPSPNCELSDEVLISHINAANDFYIQLQSHTDKLQEISQVLDNICDNLAVYKNPIEGEICIATYIEDNKKYRAKILTIGVDGCDVLFIDYGNQSYVTVLYEIPANLQLEPLALNCAMYNRFENWNENSCKYFYNLTADSEKIFKYKIVDDSVHPILIKLFDDEKDINEEMMKMLEPRSPNEAEGAVENVMSDLVDEIVRDPQQELSYEMVDQSIKSCFQSIEHGDNRMQTEIIDEIIKEVEKKVDEVVSNKLKSLDDSDGSFALKLSRRLSLNDLSKCIKEQVANSFASSGSGDLRMFGGFGDPLDSIRTSMSSSKSHENLK